MGTTPIGRNVSHGHHDELMSDLEALVPPNDLVEETLNFAGQAAISVVPVIGQLTADALAHVLARRQAQRQHDFNVAVARGLPPLLRHSVARTAAVRARSARRDRVHGVEEG